MGSKQKTKVLIIGSNGFIGRSLKEALVGDYELFEGNIIGDGPNIYYLDLLDKKTIASVLRKLQPQVIVDCAGIVENSPEADKNSIFVENLLSEAVASGLTFNRIILLSSASVYGVVKNDEKAVKEEDQLNAISPYGLSKVKEESVARKFRDKYHLPITVVRIFNPIGSGMNIRFLIPKLIAQIQEIQKDQRVNIEVSRLDAARDYLNVKDVAGALKCIIEHSPKEFVYNIGSGVRTSNGDLIKLLLENSKLTYMPMIIETEPNSEPMVASMADISRIVRDIGWKPSYGLDATIKEILSEG